MLKNIPNKITWQCLFLFCFSVGLGGGYLTSLRFYGPVGFPEVLAVLGGVYFFIKWILIGGSIRKEIAIFFFSASVAFLLFIMPVVTVFDMGEEAGSNWKNWLAYATGFSLFYFPFITSNSLIVLEKGSVFSFWVFIISLLFGGLFLPSEFLWYGGSRYTGGAINPNQLAYYSVSFLLLISIYGENKVKVTYVGGILFLAWLIDSDALTLALACGGMFFVVSWLIFSKRDFWYRVFAFCGALFVSLSAIPLLVYFNLSFFTEVWGAANEGGNRIDLLLNSIKVISEAPLIGRGSGSFSHLGQGRVGGSEAHNTFLDFAMQAGIVFPIALFVLFFVFIFKSVRTRYFVIASAAVTYFVLINFHFAGRHFIFWFILAVLCMESFAYSGVLFDDGRKERQHRGARCAV